MVIKFFYATYQADVTFLEHVQKGHAAADVFLGHACNQPQVGFRQMFFGPFGFDLNILNVAFQLLFIYFNGVNKILILGQGFDLIQGGFSRNSLKDFIG